MFTIDKPHVNTPILLELGPDPGAWAALQFGGSRQITFGLYPFSIVIHLSLMKLYYLHIRYFKSMNECRCYNRINIIQIKAYKSTLLCGEIWTEVGI